MERITKPLICEECPVCHIDKKVIKCRVCDLEAPKNNNPLKFKMWQNCKLDWDK